MEPTTPVVASVATTSGDVDSMSLTSNRSDHIHWRSNSAFCYLLNKLFRHRGRNRNALVAANDHGIDPNHFAFCIDQRTPGIPGCKGHIGTNDKQLVPTFVVGVHQRAHNSTRDCVALPPWMAEGKDHLSHARRNRSRPKRVRCAASMDSS